jgi:imidazolonepropionase-like amidohydrolase
MSDLAVISDGALLIRDGIIEEAGHSRRIENLSQARRAHEIDASGKIVMPAFVDPDIALAVTPPDNPYAEKKREPDIRRISARRLLSNAAWVAADLVSYGVLTAGAHTLYAPDLRNSQKALRLHQHLQGKPLRIRSVFSPAGGPDAGEDLTAAGPRGLDAVCVSQEPRDSPRSSGKFRKDGRGLAVRRGGGIGGLQHTPLRGRPGDGRSMPACAVLGRHFGCGRGSRSG